MTRRKDAAGSSSQAGNVGSEVDPGPARPWTDEEMAASKPLPLPTVEPTEKGRPAGVPHAGTGKTKPAGRPEDDKAER